MPSLKVRNDANTGIYFITCSVKNLYYLFDRHNRWEILLDSLRFCHANKGLNIFAWVFMLNHIHLLIESEDVSGLLRDFKRHTVSQIKKNLLAHEPAVLQLFERDGIYEFWEKTNIPQKIESMYFFRQKYDYIHQNPVRKKYVEKPEDWYYSSAHRLQLLPLSIIES